MSSKKLLRFSVILMLSIGLALPAFTCPKCAKGGVSKLNIWVSDLDRPCGTWDNDWKEKEESKITWKMTILDCDGVLYWPCGRYLAIDGTWKPVPNGKYVNLPFKCGHMEVEVPPGCYWITAAYRVGEGKDDHVRFNKSTHVGIVQVGCGDNACVKLFNPSIKLCWTWFRYGMIMNSMGRQPAFDPQRVRQIETQVNTLLRDIPDTPAERAIGQVFEGLIESSKKEQQRQRQK